MASHVSHHFNLIKLFRSRPQIVIYFLCIRYLYRCYPFMLFYSVVVIVMIGFTSFYTNATLLCYSILCVVIVMMVFTSFYPNSFRYPCSILVCKTPNPFKLLIYCYLDISVSIYSQWQPTVTVLKEWSLGL